MIQYECWPPPDWPEVIITWKTMLDYSDYSPNMIMHWIDNAPGGRYHLHGFQATEGFAFRFERPEDATMFALRWGND